MLTQISSSVPEAQLGTGDAAEHLRSCAGAAIRSADAAQAAAVYQEFVDLAFKGRCGVSAAGETQWTPGQSRYLDPRSHGWQYSQLQRVTARISRRANHSRRITRPDRTV